jgi:hypothetical protein
MRLWLLELQKIFAPRPVIVSLSVFVLCFMVWLFTPIAGDKMDGYDYRLPMQMLEDYGRTMEPADIADFESKFQAAEKEMMDYAAQLGLGEFSPDEQNAADEFYASEPYIEWIIMLTYEQPYAFFGSSVNSFFLMNRRIFEMTFGQLILAYIAQMYLLSLGAALAAFIASRFSKNLMSLVIKAVPIGALLILLQTYAMTGGMLYTKLEPNSSAFTDGLGLWGLAANTAWLALAAALSAWIVHRDRRIDLGTVLK